MHERRKKPIQAARRLRDEDEMRAVEFFPVKFVHGGDAFTAQLTNISPRGAHLQMSDRGQERHHLEIGHELQLDVRTPYGDSHCSATIVWFDSEAAPLSIGVEFTTLSSDRSDPLRCTMDSAL
jgi:hypothetical protein